MFVARAGLKTRNLGEGQSGLTALLAPKRKKKDDDYRFICWVPFMLGPCIGGLIGLVVLLGGTAMCATGYYAKHFASTYSDNGTHIIATVDSSREFHMYNMTFVGPVIMGCGCFVIVIACVVVCEQRDKDVRMKIAQAQKKKDQNKSKKNKFYDSVVERLKKSELLNPGKDKAKISHKDCKPNKHEKGKNKGSHKPRVFTLVPCIVHKEDETDTNNKQYSHISEALRSIPMDIFTIDVDKKGNNTMLPIKVTDPTTQIEEYKNCENVRKRFPAKKCPSAACIQELVKVEESRLNQLFPDRHTWLRKTKTDVDLLKRINKQDAVDHRSDRDEALIDFHLETFPKNIKSISNDQSCKNQDKKKSDESCSINGSILTISSYQSDMGENDSNLNDIHTTDIVQHNCDNISDNTENYDRPGGINDNLSDNGHVEGINPGNKVILCEASVHKEEITPSTNQKTTGNNQITESEVMFPSENLNVSNDNLLLDNHKVLILTSGLARANAAAMDGFKRPGLSQAKSKTIESSSENLSNECVMFNHTNLAISVETRPEEEKEIVISDGRNIDPHVSASCDLVDIV